ncbi:ABC transporter ATP-binding protein [Parvicella tangerina]|uniref:Multidrug efflux system ATP-binding protein n=1 Tax=Parvicella tangerina TaxID=2829795 RepID=A0A916JLJ4_9FLAO|nr:ABC transporter ATP-binding protein [Parvicella tangerina]CAG5081018.1 Multidrug efflux system ATP-binding protein [Parvicella tangerina]
MTKHHLKAFCQLEGFFIADYCQVLAAEIPYFSIMKAIEFNNLTKYYGNSLGMKDVTFEVEQGEVFGFIGPNGAGKSTAIRTLLGLLKPTSGSAKVLGMDSEKQGAELRKKIGYLPSEVNYYAEMTSRELLAYSAGFYESVDLKEIDRLAEHFELDLDKEIEDLSFGNKKKCAIVQCLLHKPELLILDEPTSGLDPLMQNRFFDLLEELNKQGTTIFFSSHVLSEIQRMCDRAAVIRKGEIIAVEHIQHLLEKQMKKVKLTLSDDQALTQFPDGAQNEKQLGNKVTFEYLGGINPLLDWLSSCELQDLVMEEPDLESIFMNYYKR